MDSITHDDAFLADEPEFDARPLVIFNALQPSIRLIDRALDWLSDRPRAEAAIVVSGAAAFLVALYAVAGAR